MNIVSYKNGNILEDESEAIIIPVNCVGVAGKGLAKEWASRFHKAYTHYKKCCESGDLVKIGSILPTREGNKWFLCFPTKNDWKYDSEIEYIEQGMTALGQVIATLNIKSLAIPALGCGNGGLDWEEVLPIILQELEYLNENYNLGDLKVVLYEPR